MYICKSCGKKVDQIEKFVTCPYCGAKMMDKERPPIAKTIKAE